MWEFQETRAWLDEVGAEDMSVGCVSSLVTFISESLLPYEVCGFTLPNTPCHDVHLDTDPELYDHDLQFLKPETKTNLTFSQDFFVGKQINRPREARQLAASRP